MRFGGRKAGTPNKRSLEAREKADQMGIDPLMFLLLLVRGDLRDLGYDFGPDYDPTDRENFVLDKDLKIFHPKHLVPLNMRKEAAKEAAPYLDSKLKSVEVTVDEESKKYIEFISKDEFNRPKGAA